MKKRFILTVCAMGAFFATFTACSTLQSVSEQVLGLANLVNCQYEMKNVDNIYVAGVNLQNITNGNIGVADVAKLSAAVLAKSVPLSMDVNVNVTNPTTNNAALTAMDWILDIDGAQVATGTSSKAYTIKQNSTTTIALPVSTDIYSVCNNVNSLKTFVQSFTGDGTSSKVGVRIKPSISVGGVNIPSPDYITLEKKTGTTSGSSNHVIHK